MQLNCLEPGAWDHIPEHPDKNRGTSAILLLGEYEGGDLVFQGGRVWNTPGVWLEFDGTERHRVTKVTAGRRFSMVWFDFHDDEAGEPESDADAGPAAGPADPEGGGASGDKARRAGVCHLAWEKASWEKVKEWLDDWEQRLEQKERPVTSAREPHWTEDPDSRVCCLERHDDASWICTSCHLAMCHGCRSYADICNTCADIKPPQGHKQAVAYLSYVRCTDYARPAVKKAVGLGDELL